MAVPYNHDERDGGAEGVCQSPADRERHAKDNPRESAVHGECPRARLPVSVFVAGCFHGCKLDLQHCVADGKLLTATCCQRQAFNEHPHIVAGFACFEDDRAIYMVQASFLSALLELIAECPLTTAAGGRDALSGRAYPSRNTRRAGTSVTLPVPTTAARCLR